MPARHSKNSGDRHHFTYQEKLKAGYGSLKQRLGTESQLPFGYCSLSMHPAEDPVITPSGHLYSREFILEYLLTKSKEIKKQSKAFEEQEENRKKEEIKTQTENQIIELKEFEESQQGLLNTKRKANDNNSAYFESRKKFIDDTDKSVKLQELKKVSPWIPQFTPNAEVIIKEPIKRPSSPFSGKALRSKDLIPLNLVKEDGKSDNSSIVRFVCPVTRKTITNQKVLLIKTTGVYMIESAFKDLALPTKTCPLSGKPFLSEEVVELVSAASGFASSGQVEAKVHRSTIN